ncbi:MAG: DUF3299 domain-containing protein [Flavobacteriales bacterium]|jgi:hypothetical protein
MVKKIAIIGLVLAVLISVSGFIYGSASVKAKKAGTWGAATFEKVEAPVYTSLPGNPVEVTWKTLADVQFKDVYVKELDAYYWKPTFGSSVKALENREIYITGYVIPVDYDANFYVVSRYPYANCFFCGGGGPESVVDLRFSGKPPRAYKTDERLTFKGKLKLNGDDVYSMNYILLGATEYKP